MIQKVSAIVKQIAHKEGFDVIIEKQAAAYFRNDLDVTDRVIQTYNAGDPGAGAKAPAKPAAPKAPAAAPKPAPKK
jgi:outer membrane protein